MKFGWRPKLNVADPPIPLYFNYAGYSETMNEEAKEIFSGMRPRDSYDVHWVMANRPDTYTFKFPNLMQFATYDYPPPLQEIIESLPEY